jgi:hypothetical protein
MKTHAVSIWKRSLRPAILLMPLSLAFSAHALDLNHANKGADGVLFPFSNEEVIDLASANAGAWDSVPAKPGRGVYDDDKWAVVFKFSSVNIPSTATVRFVNNASRAPVVWLVDGDVKIDGTVDLSGRSPDGRQGLFTEPGPGGFSGGRATIPGADQGNGGFGPGGGMRNGGAGFAKDGTLGEIGGDWWHDRVRAGSFPYGDAQMLNLIGGSGGGGGVPNSPERSGGAGGGAILMAAKGRIVINGKVIANGGNGWDASGGGSGGTVRLVSESFSGSGVISVLGGGGGRPGSPGRIRLEAVSVSGEPQLLPPVPVARPDSPVRLWPDDTTPSARIVSIGSEGVPAKLSGWIQQLPTPDITLKTSLPQHPIVVETRNLPDSAVVVVRIVPATGSPREVQAYLTSRNGATATWTANNDVPPGMFVAQVRAKAR